MSESSSSWESHFIPGTDALTFGSSANKNILNVTPAVTGQATFGQTPTPATTSNLKSSVTSSLTFGTAEKASPPSSSLFTFGKIASPNEPAKSVAPFSFGAATNKEGFSSTLQPQVAPSANFSFDSAPNKTIKNKELSTGNTTPASSGLFGFGQTSAPDGGTLKQPTSPVFSFGKSDKVQATSPQFGFGNLPVPQEVPKKDAPFSFSVATTKAPTAAQVPPTSSASSTFSFGSDSNKPKESGVFSFGNPASTNKQPSGGIFSFGNTKANDSSQVSTNVPARPDSAQSAPFQFSGSTSQPSAPQKTFAFGQSNTSEPFKFNSPTAGSSDTPKAKATPFGATLPTAFGVASPSATFATSPVQNSASSTSGLFQFGGSGSSNLKQPVAPSNAGAGVFSFGNSGASNTTAPFGATSPRQNTSSPFGNNSATGAGATATATQPSSGFNFAANANTAVPGVFQFGAAAPSNNPAPAASSFSFGNALANAPSLGSSNVPSMGQTGGTPGGNMFSIGTSSNNASMRGRTIRTAARRRPK